MTEDKYVLTEEFMQFLQLLEKNDPATAQYFYNLLASGHSLDRKISTLEPKPGSSKTGKKTIEPAAETIGKLSSIMKSTNSSEISQEIGKLTKSPGDSSESQEISKFMESIEKVFSFSSDEAMYDSYVVAKSSPQRETSPVVGEKEYYISLNEKEGIKTLEDKLSHRRRRKKLQHHRGISKLPMRKKLIIACGSLISLISLAILSYIFFIPKNEAKTSTKPAGVSTKILVSSAPSAKAPEQMSEAPKEDHMRNTSVVDLNGDLTKLLSQNSYNEEDIVATLLLFSNNKSLTSQHIPVLDQLYEKYQYSPLSSVSARGQDTSLCRVIISIIGEIGGEEARVWLEKIAWNAKVDKILIVENLWKFRDYRARKTILDILQRESSPEICLNLLDFLDKTGLTDRELQENLIGKFYTSSDETVRCCILSILAKMPTSHYNFFFQLVSNNKYSLIVRMNTMDAMMSQLNSMNHPMENASDLLFELSKLAATTEELVLKQKINEVVNLLSEKE